MAGWPLAAAKRQGEFQILWPLQPLKQKGNFNIPARAGGGRNWYVFQIWKQNDGRRIDRAIQLLTVARKLARPSRFPPIKSLHPPVPSRHHSHGSRILPPLPPLLSPTTNLAAIRWMQQRGRSFNRRSRSFSRARLAIEGS